MMKDALITPPLMAVSEADDMTLRGEDVELLFLDGRKIVGKFFTFDAARKHIEISLKVREKSAMVFFPLDEIKMLRFLSDREWLADKDLKAKSRDGFSLHAEKLDINVVFVDGEQFSGHLFGFRENSYGLSLFAKKGENSYACIFMPHSAIKSHEVGPRIGEVLIKEKLVSKDQIDTYLAYQKEQRNRQLGDYLSAKMLVSVEEVEKALELQKSFPNVKLGEILVGEKLITQDQLKNALAEQKETRNKPLGQILVEAGVVSTMDIQLGLSKKLGIPFVDLRKFPLEPEIHKRIPEHLARRYQVLPLFEHHNHLIVAMTDPLDYKLLETLKFHSDRVVDPVFAPEEDLKRTIDLVYQGMGLSEILSDEYLSEKENNEDAEDSAILKAEESDNVVIKLVNKLITDAYLDNASDIHIEPRSGKEKTLVRFRRDGILRNYYEIPAHLRHAVVARIKIMANLDISVKRTPQDGKISFGKFSATKVDLRVATLPTAGGEEDVVLRLLGSSKPIPFGKLGLIERDKETVEKIIAKPYGLFLVCGPTGSGKTTTLHSILGTINTPERKIWTAEDPIEISQAGLRQVQMHPKIGLTFATAMRSFLRADPDVIMVGEMRDKETAKIGIEASLTGHLVLTTLHTNSAAESVVRLIDMGMDPLNFADALLGILAQRLVRTLCKHCKVERKATDEEIQKLAHEYCLEFSQELPEEITAEATIIDRWRKNYGTKDGQLMVHSAAGCDDCHGSGYLGRTGIYELLEGTQAIKKLVIESATVRQLLKTAMEEGMRTLKQDGIEKILQGQTDLQQVRKVCAN